MEWEEFNTAVTINKKKLTLTVENSSETLAAEVTPINVKDKSVRWSSEDPSVATVSQSGEVTAVGNGGTNLSQNSVTVKENQILWELPTVQRKNYMFEGWYTAKTGGIKIDSGMAITQSQTSGAKGYEISYSMKKKFKSGVHRTSTRSLSKSMKGLKKGKVYYVHVRAYEIDSMGSKVYGGYSKVRKREWAAFSHCTFLEEVVIPDKVERIASFACVGLRSALVCADMCR